MSTTTEDKVISYKIISSEGHTDASLPQNEALLDIKDKVENESKWLYLDKEHKADVTTLTVDELLNAEDIMLTNLQVGG